MKFRSLLSAGFLMAAVSGVAVADVTGTIKFEGTAPKMKVINMAAVAACAAQHKTPVTEESVIVKDGKLANVVISITNPPAGGKPAAEPAVLDQKGCQYVPHVVALMVGQKFLVKNSDPFLHNVHGLPENNPGFNFGQNNVDPAGKAVTLKSEEVFRTKCDVHPWMSAWIAVFEHPYFAVSGADGAFAIKGLKDGEYNVKAWHEKLGEQEGKVKVAGGKGTVDFTFKPEEAAAPVQNVKDVSLASLTGLQSVTSTAACEGKECCSAKEAAKPAATAVAK